MKLVVFHYHFLTGGVTTAVRQALEAFRSFLPGTGQVQLVGGRTAPGLPEQLARDGVAFHSLPPIDYRGPRGPGRRRTAEQARRLASLLLERFGGSGSVWWVHNHHLGKNPVFTQAVLEALRRAPAQRAILEIHDFPECGRSANLRRLQTSVSLPPYPVAPNVRYAVLTDGDRRVLTEAGIPEAAVFLLGNPVPPASVPEVWGPDGPDPERAAATKRRLRGAFGKLFPAFDPARALALYPVRTIRRKNVLEACLLAGLAEDPLSLVVTLPGVSQAERRYSARVRRVFRAGCFSGLWGIGPRLGAAGLRFEDLVNAADLVVSSSVQEGFGYLFINALQWRRPLLARWLEVLEGTAELYAGYPAYFYRELRCPLDRSARDRLREAYRRRIARLAGLIRREKIHRLLLELDGRLGSELAEFSFLNVAEQEATLAGLTDRGFARALREANPEIAAAIPELLSAPVPDLDRRIQGSHGPRRYASAFRSILSSFEHPGVWAPDPASIQPRIVRHFARLEHLRMLYD